MFHLCTQNSAVYKPRILFIQASVTTMKIIILTLCLASVAVAGKYYGSHDHHHHHEV